VGGGANSNRHMDRSQKSNRGQTGTHNTLVLRSPGGHGAEEQLSGLNPEKLPETVTYIGPAKARRRRPAGSWTKSKSERNLPLSSATRPSCLPLAMPRRR
jgi:hypothetical protein